MPYLAYTEPTPPRITLQLMTKDANPMYTLLDITAATIVFALNTPTYCTITLPFNAIANFANHQLVSTDNPASLIYPNPRLAIHRTPGDVESDATLGNNTPKLIAHLELLTESQTWDYEAQTWTGTFYDPLARLQNIFTTAGTTFTSYDPGNMLWFLLNAVNGYDLNSDTWLREGAHATGLLTNQTFPKATSLGTIFQDATGDQNGIDYWVDPLLTENNRIMGIFRAAAKRGAQIAGAVFYPQGEEKNCGEAVLSAMEICTRVIAGASTPGKNPKPIEAIVGGSDSAYGRIDYQVSAKTPMTQAQLTAFAQGIYNERALTSRSGLTRFRTKIDIGRVFPGGPTFKSRESSGYDIGDTVKFMHQNSRLGGLPGYSWMRVYQVTIEISANGKYTESVMLGDPRDDEAAV